MPSKWPFLVITAVDHVLTIGAAHGVLWPILVISSRRLAPEAARVFPMRRRSWKCTSTVMPALNRARIQSSRKVAPA